MYALREQQPEDQRLAPCPPASGRWRGHLLAVLALAALLATVMVPNLTTGIHVLTEADSGSGAAHMAWELAPVMPPSALGDQHYEFTRAALIVSHP